MINKCSFIIKIAISSAIATNLIRKRDRPESWLFSRFSTGWVCGLHADWTELSSCVDNELDRMHGTPIKRRYRNIFVASQCEFIDP